MPQCSLAAPIYLVAQAVERLLEPIASRYQTTDDEKAAVKEATEEKLRAGRAIIWWLAATLVSLALCGALGPGILEAMSTKPRSRHALGEGEGELRPRYATDSADAGNSGPTARRSSAGLSW